MYVKRINFSEECIEELENQLNALLVSDTVIDNLNKNPYNVNFEFCIKAILDNIALYNIYNIFI